MSAILSYLAGWLIAILGVLVVWFVLQWRDEKIARENLLFKHADLQRQYEHAQAQQVSTIAAALRTTQTGAQAQGGNNGAVGRSSAGA